MRFSLIIRARAQHPTAHESVTQAGESIALHEYARSGVCSRRKDAHRRFWPLSCTLERASGLRLVLLLRLR